MLPYPVALNSCVWADNDTPEIAGDDFLEGLPTGPIRVYKEPWNARASQIPQRETSLFFMIKSSHTWQCGLKSRTLHFCKCVCACARVCGGKHWLRVQCPCWSWGISFPPVLQRKISISMHGGSSAGLCTRMSGVSAYSPHHLHLRFKTHIHRRLWWNTVGEE